MEPLPEKLEVIKNIVPTKNVDEAHQILGLLGYYRSFIPAFADKTTPITNLLKKNTPFVWSKQCQDMLDYLKEIFCNKPILQFPNPNKDYILYTDASNNAYSSVLCQLQSNDNDIRQVTYFSGTFTAQNKSWCATKKEAYAMLKSIQRFNYYLSGAKCTLKCNHKPLELFLSRAMKIAKLDRWAMLLQEYNITFSHIKGKDNILADAISWLCTVNIYEDPAENGLLHSPTAQNKACSNKATDSVQLLYSRTTQQLLNITTRTLWNLQKQDRFCKKKVCELHTGLQNQFYLNSSSILKWKIIKNNLEINAIVVPAPLVYTLLYKFHNCKGHQGSDRMTNMLKQKFWWKGMKTHVKNHINSCMTCSKTFLILQTTPNCT